jgi:hypothetical protein
MPAINRAVIAGLQNTLVQLYSGHARANHKKLADQFNTAAKEFAAAAAIVDPERRRHRDGRRGQGPEIGVALRAPKSPRD